MTTGGNFSGCGPVGTRTDHELEVLCDAEGSPFLRLYSIADDGTTTFVDTELDATTPFTAVEPVGSCAQNMGEESPGDESPSEECLHCQTVTLCTTTDGGSPGEAERIPYPPANGPTSGTLTSGVGWQVNVGQPGQAAFANHYLFGHAAPSPIGPQVWTFDQPVGVRFAVTNLWNPAAGAAPECVQLPEGVALVSLAPRHTYDAATRTVCGSSGGTNDLLAESVFETTSPVTELVLTDVSTIGTSVVGTAWMEVAAVPADGPSVSFLRTLCRDCSGAVVSIRDEDLDGNPITVTGPVHLCGPGSGDESPSEECLHCHVVSLCDFGDESPGESPGEAEPAIPFLRKICFDCAGDLVSVADTDLDGQPYQASPNIGVCSTDKPCQDTSTVLVCDLPTDGQPEPVVTDTDPVVIQPGPGQQQVDGGAAVLWSGGTLTIPPDTAPPPDDQTQGVRMFAATVQADRPVCDTGDATITATITVQRDGPDPGCQGTGSWRLLVGGSQIDSVNVVPTSVPVGTVNVMKVTGRVPAAELAAGTVTLLGRLETYHRSSGSCPGGSNPDGARIGGWIVNDFTIEATFDQTGCDTQVFASILTDCETGRVISVTYSTTDGQPYEPTGEIGPCVPVSGAEPCGTCSDCGVDASTTVGTIAPASAGGTGTAVDTPITQYISLGATGRALNGQIGIEQHPGGGQPLWDGGAITVGPDSGPGPGAIGPEHYRGVAAVLTQARPACDDETVEVTVSVRVTNNGSTAAIGSPGGMKLANVTNRTPYVATFITGGAPAGHVQTLTLTATVPASDLDAGQIAVLLFAESWQQNTAKSWTFDEFEASFAFGTDGCISPPQASQLVSVCKPMPTINLSDAEPTVWCDGPGGTEFVRHFRYGGADGKVTGFYDTTPDGMAYTPINAPVVCGGGATPCEHVESMQLCDLDVAPVVMPETLTDTPPLQPPMNATQQPLPAGGASLWTGGALTFPADPDASAGDGAQLYRSIAAILQADRPECDTGVATISARVHLTQNGPTAGLGTAGAFRLYLDDTSVAGSATLNNTPVGFDQNVGFTVNNVDVVALEEGRYKLYLWLETFQAGGKAWTANQLVITITYPQDGCEKPFLRHFVHDCDGALVSTNDTELDGSTLYVPSDSVGTCGVDRQAYIDCGVDASTTSGVIAPAGDGTAGDVNPAHYIGPGLAIPDDIGAEAHPAAAAVWTAGGIITVPPDIVAGPGSTTEHHRAIASVLQVDRPSCDSGTVKVTVSMRVENEGPDPSVGAGGALVLANAITGSRYDADNIAVSAPVGHVQTLEASFFVPASELDAGQIAAVLYVETWSAGQAAGRGWTVDQFQSSFEFGDEGCISPPREVQLVKLCGPVQTMGLTDVEPVVLCDGPGGVAFVRHYRYGPDGAPAGFRDTELDGATPFAPSGDPVACSSGGGAGDSSVDAEIVVLCSTDAAGVSTKFLRHFTYNPDGTPTGTPIDTTLAGGPFTAETVAVDCPTPCFELRTGIARIGSVTGLQNITPTTQSILAGGLLQRVTVTTITAGPTGVSAHVDASWRQDDLPAGITHTFQISGDQEDSMDSGTISANIADGADALVTWEYKVRVPCPPQ